MQVSSVPRMQNNAQEDQNESGCFILQHLKIRHQGDVSPITPNDIPIVKER